jgi:hypothetical protein
MASSAYQTAVLALHGATGAAGETLQILQHLALDETSTAGAADDASSANRDGAYVNAPTANASGPLMPETSGGRSITLNGTTQIVNGGVADDLFTAMTNEGLTFMAWMKNSDTAAARHFFGFRIGGDKGFIVGFNLNALGNYAAGGRTIGCIVASSGYARYHGTQWNAPTGDTRFNDDQWHLVEIFVKVTGTGNPTFRCFLDTVQQSNSNDQNVGTILVSDLIGNGTSRFGIGGTYSNTTPFAYGAGSVAQSTVIRGSLTQAQRRAAYAAASYQVRGLPVRIAHFDAADAFSDLIGATPSVDEGIAQSLVDSSGNANNLAAPTLANSPGFLDNSHYPRAELAFDNLYQAHGVTPRRHLLKNSATTPVHPWHCGVIIVCRPQITSIFGRTQQELGGICTAAGVGVAMLALQCSGANADTVTLQQGAVVRAAAAGMPRCFTMPGTVVVGFNVSGDVAGSIRLFMNRWAANASAAHTASTTVTGIHMGSVAAGTDGMFAGLISEMVVTTPFTDAEFTAFCQSVMAEVGETLTPENHVTAMGDSIGAGEGTTHCRNFLYYLPAGARRSTSWRNASVATSHLGGSGVNVIDRDFTDADWWLSTARENYAILQAGVNDANAGDTGANMITEAGLIRAAAVTGGMSKWVVMGLGVNASATPRNAYNSGQQALEGSTVYRFVPAADMTGHLPDALHPDDDWAEQMGADLWRLWGVGSLEGVKRTALLMATVVLGMKGRR